MTGLASDEVARESWRLKQRAERERARQMGRPPGDPGRNPLRMPLLIRLFFVLAGLAILVPATGYYLYAQYRASAAQFWPRAQAQVLRSHVRSTYSRSDDGGGSTSYYAIVLYRYEVGGVRYDNDNVWLNGPATTHRPEEAQAVVDAYPAGRPALVPYNPDDPMDAALVLNRPRWQLLFFTAFGLIWLSATYAFNRRIRPAGNRRPWLSPKMRDRLFGLGIVAWFGLIVGTILYFMFFF